VPLIIDDNIVKENFLKIKVAYIGKDDLSFKNNLKNKAVSRVP
jgi:hypothetical protein